jgi:hypothetical protein
MREQHKLERGEYWQEEWAKFKKGLSQKTGKLINDLVVHRAEDYRRVIEESDLMFKATPIEKRQGGNVWQMSLRRARCSAPTRAPAANRVAGTAGRGTSA